MVAGNGYGTNGSDLGSGVTVYGEGSLAWLKKSTVQSNKGGGVLVHRCWLGWFGWLLCELVAVVVATSRKDSHRRSRGRVNDVRVVAKKRVSWQSACR